MKNTFEKTTNSSETSNNNSEPAKKTRLQEIEAKINNLGEKKKGSKKNRNEIQNEIDKLNLEKKKLVEKESIISRQEKRENMKKEKDKEKSFNPGDTVEMSGKNLETITKIEATKAELLDSYPPKTEPDATENEEGKETEVIKEKSKNWKTKISSLWNNTFSKKSAVLTSASLEELIPEEKVEETKEEESKQEESGDENNKEWWEEELLNNKSPETKEETKEEEPLVVENKEDNKEPEEETTTKGRKIKKVITSITGAAPAFVYEDEEEEEKKEVVKEDKKEDKEAPENTEPELEETIEETKEEEPVVVENKEDKKEPESKGTDEGEEGNKEKPVSPTGVELEEARNNNESGIFVMPANKGFWEKMSGKGKSMISSIYKGLNMVPGVNRLMAKMAIGYNQFWIDKKEGKAVELKEKMDGLDLNIKNFQQSKIRMREIMENLKKSGNPGTESMSKEINKMEREEEKMLNQKNKLQSKIELRENKIKVFANKRDNIADKMIVNYEKNLSPIEQNLRLINDQRDKMNLFVAGKEIEIEEQEEELKVQGHQMEEFMASLISAGRDPEKARKSVRSFEKIIEKGRTQIKEKRGELKKQQDRVNENIAKIDAKAQPYRDRRDQFANIKKRGLVEFNLKERSKVANEKTLETTSSHPRLNPEEVVSTRTIRASTPDNTSTYSVEQRPSISKRISDYNESLKNIVDGDNLKIDEVFLLNSINLKKESTPSLENFKKVINLYYKVKKLPEERYKTLLNNIK